MLRLKSTSKPSRPSHHANDAGTLFKNPWDSSIPPTWTELLIKQEFPVEWYKEGLPSHAKAQKLEVVTPDWGDSSLRERNLERERCIVGTWLGHASSLAELPLQGITSDETKRSAWFLFDPIFSYRAGPTQYTGPSRFNKSPCQVADLPGCDAVFVSHNHYDHLDASSIQSLVSRFPKAKYFVPLRNKSILAGMGVPKGNLYELDWWNMREFSPLDFGCALKEGSEEIILRFTCVPAQHNSGRGALDKDSTLWCGWVIEQTLCSKDEANASATRRHGSIYHAGDTGYRRIATSDVVCPAFKEIGSKFGPFDLSFIPIWRGGTLGFLSNMGLRLLHKNMPAQNHGSPMDAVAMHLDVKSRNTIGIHFGTFVGSENEALEAVIEFGEACDAKGVQDLVKVNDVGKENGLGRAGTIDIGASCVVGIGGLE